jgi:hemoglobin
MAAGSASAQSGQSLYKRLGGYDAIAAVIDDFVPRLASDPKLAQFFSGASDNSRMRIRQLLVDQICAATGGPCLYLGRDMKTAHKGLGITEEQWNAAATALVASLDKLKVPKKEKDDLLAIVVSLKKDIVEMPQATSR